MGAIRQAADAGWARLWFCRLSYPLGGGGVLKHRDTESTEYTACVHGTRCVVAGAYFQRAREDLRGDMVLCEEQAGRCIMSHTFEISDEAYQTLKALAATRGQKPEDLLEQWLDEVPMRVPAQASLDPSVNADAGDADPTFDPLAAFLGAFEATAPDVVRAYVGEE